MRSSSTSIKGTYLIGAYLCSLALMFVAKDNNAWLGNLAKWGSPFLLILFLYLNTAIDSKFEKNIFYGILLFTLSGLIPLAEPVIGVYVGYLILALWIIAYFSYTRALISITSGSSTILFKHKWLAGLLFFAGLVGLYFLLSSLALGLGGLTPWICLGLATILYFMASVNLLGQISMKFYGLYVVGGILLLGYNCHSALNISRNISIFDSEMAVLFYLGQLIFIFASVQACVQFRNNDFSEISSILKTKKNHIK